MAYNPDPAEELPGEFDNVQTVPLGLPNQFGGRIVGKPVGPPDPLPQTVPGDVVINPAAIVDPAARAAYIAAHPATVPIPAPAIAQPAPVVSSVPVPSTVTAPTPTAPVQALHTGAGASGKGLPPDAADLEKMIKEGSEDEKAKLQNLADTQDTAQQRVADAIDAKADLQRQQAADLAAEQLSVRERQKTLDAEDAENLRQAQQTTIPDFWEGREGKMVGAAVTVALSGAASALLGSTGNTALSAIQHNVDTYFQRGKDRIDNLYKYAEMKGQLNDKVRAQYAGELTDLMQQHAYTLASVADHIQAVQAESQGAVNKAQSDYLASQLKNQAASQLLSARGFDVQRYNAQSTRIEANAAATRAAAERDKAKADLGDKQNEAAFRTYVQGPHGKTSQVLQQRLANIDSASEDIKNAKSVGEVTKAIEAVIAADTGQGSRGVSMGQLHTVLPNLVSASGEISNKVSQNWDGTAGKEFKGAALRLVNQVKQNRESEYKRTGDQLEASLGQTPFGKAHPDFAKTSRAQLYPDRGTTETATADPNAEALSWANANPTDPRAKQIKARLGQ